MQQQPGEYPQPLLRTTELRVPVIAGLVTGRLRSIQATFNGSTSSDQAVLVNVKNTGSASLTVMFSDTNDYVNGPFVQNGGVMTIAPLGNATNVIYPKLKYLEFIGVTGTGYAHVKLTSQLRFDECAFDRTEGRASALLWDDNQPGWSTL
jgi:hypothetical protein